MLSVGITESVFPAPRSPRPDVREVLPGSLISACYLKEAVILVEEQELWSLSPGWSWRHRDQEGLRLVGEEVFAREQP